MTDIHSCSYFCDRPECIKAQRDELRERLAQPEQESFSPEAISATQAAWKMGYDAAKAEPPEQEPVALVIDGVLVKSELPEKYTGHLYTTPPRRKPEQEPIKESSVTHSHLWIGELWRKEKNT
jgi:hypothetical protein